jgi:AraC-like DNA-binding protein
LAKASQIRVDTRPIDHIGQLLLSNPLAFSLDKMAAEACLSHRAFEKRFVQQVGVTPKYFTRICRFEKAFKQKESQPSLDWLSLAVDHGYTDYQHLVKDFKQFGGVTPTLLIQQTAHDPEHLLGIKPELR